MDEEREGMMPDKQADEPQNAQEETAAEQAEAPTRLDEDEEVLSLEEGVADKAVIGEEGVAEVTQEDITADQTEGLEIGIEEPEGAARLGEGELIEEAPEESKEPVEDMTVTEIEKLPVESETPPRKRRRGKVEETSARLIDEGVPDFSQVPQGDGESDGRAWYVVHCYSGYENKVRHNLEQRIESMGMKNQIFDVVVPTEEEIEVKEGKRRTVERRVFPGYILVNMILTEESWYVVRNTPGVTSFVGQGNTPLPLRPEEVSQIVKRMEAEAPRIKVSFKQGERVRIVDGPFNDFRGTVSEIDMERAKVRVMVNFFGRETPVELDFLQVEKS
jgi:transcription termination/antitermination protein NusG